MRRIVLVAVFLCAPWARAEVRPQLGTTAATTAATTAYGGVRLAKQRSAGKSILLLPFPTHGGHQRVDMRSLSIRLVGDRGESLASAISSFTVVPHPVATAEKQLLRLELSLDRLPAASHLGWSVGTQLIDRPADLSRSLPISPKAQLPHETLSWLNPAPMIQSEAPDLVAVANQIRGRAHDLQSLVHETLAEITRRRLPYSAWSHAPDDWQNDAVSFLRSGFGECVAHANLFAALMRANGVPTRVVSVIQRGTSLVQNMHYQNEYYAAGQGWVHVEPQGSDVQTPRTSVVHTGVVSSSMEQFGHGFMHYAGVHRHTMIGQIVDSAGALEALPGLLVSPGLQRATDSGLGIHGAP